MHTTETYLLINEVGLTYQDLDEITYEEAKRLLKAHSVRKKIEDEEADK